MRTLAVIFIFCLSACTNQAIYESTQSEERLKCLQEPTPSAQEKCRERLLPYREYETRRKEL